MGYTVDKDPSNPSLAEMTEAALKVLTKNPNGYYLFVEGKVLNSINNSIFNHRMIKENKVNIKIDLTMMILEGN